MDMSRSRKRRLGSGGLGADYIVASCEINRDTSARVMAVKPGKYCVATGSWRTTKGDRTVACGSSLAEAKQSMRALCDQ